MTDKFVRGGGWTGRGPEESRQFHAGLQRRGDTPDAVTGAGTKLGNDLVTSLDTAIAAVRRAQCRTIQTNLTNPIIRAFDDATAAVERLIGAIKRLAALNANRRPGVGVAPVEERPKVGACPRGCWPVRARGLAWLRCGNLARRHLIPVEVGDTLGVWLHAG